MLTPATISAIDRVRDTDEGHFYADAFLDALRSFEFDLTGTLYLEAPDHAFNTYVYPPNYPNLIQDDTPGNKIINRWNYQQPGTGGAQGGYTMQFQGPVAFTPNRDGDLVIYAPNGGIDAGAIYSGGEEIVPPTGGQGCSSSGTYAVFVVDGVQTCVEVGECS